MDAVRGRDRDAGLRIEPEDGNRVVALVRDQHPAARGIDREVPRRFNLLAVYIQEPDKRTGEAGHVFFWASDLDPDADQRPRAYKLPFSPGYKSVFQEGQGKLRQNIPQIGEAEPEDVLHGVPSDRQQLGQKSVKIKFRDAPPAGPPSKEAGG